SARRETTLQREVAVKNVSFGIFDPSLGIFDPARCRRNPDFWGGFPPKPRSVLRNRQGIPRLSGVSSRAHEAGMRENGERAVAVAEGCGFAFGAGWARRALGRIAIAEGGLAEGSSHLARAREIFKGLGATLELEDRRSVAPATVAAAIQ